MNSMGSVNLMDIPLPWFLLKKIVHKMSYKSQIILQTTSKFGLDLVETFETEDFKEYCTTKAEIYKQAVVKKQALQKRLKYEGEMTLEYLKMKEEELLLEYERMAKEYVLQQNNNWADTSVDTFETVLKLCRVVELRERILENIDLWSQLC